MYPVRLARKNTSSTRSPQFLSKSPCYSTASCSSEIVWYNFLLHLRSTCDSWIPFPVFASSTLSMASHQDAHDNHDPQDLETPRPGSTKSIYSTTDDWYINSSLIVESSSARTTMSTSSASSSVLSGATTIHTEPFSLAAEIKPCITTRVPTRGRLESGVEGVLALFPFWIHFGFCEK